MQHREVVLLKQRRHERKQETLGAAGRAGRAVNDVQDVRPFSASFVEPQVECGKRKTERVVRTLPLIRRAEEGIALVEDRATAPPAFALSFLAERTTASVVHERRIFDEMPVSHAGCAQAEVDLFAVAGAEAVLVEE